MDVSLPSRRPDDISTVRSTAERQRAAISRFREGGNLWLATGGGAGPHLIPVSFWWDGVRLTTSTFDRSRTLVNLTDHPTVRAAVGSTTDVVMIDATAFPVASDQISDDAAEGYAAVSRIPRGTPGFVYVQIVPDRVQVWAGPAEFADRTVMRDGVWLGDRTRE